MVKTLIFVVALIIIGALCFLAGYNLRLIKTTYLGTIFFQDESCYMEFSSTIDEIKKLKSGYVRVINTRKKPGL